MKTASFGLMALMTLVSCSSGVGTTGPTGFLAGTWDQPTPGWETVMRLQAAGGSVSGSIQDIGPQGPGGQQTLTGTVTGSYSGGAFVLTVKYSGSVGGTYTGALGSDGRLTGIWTSAVTSDTASFWFVRE